MSASPRASRTGDGARRAHDRAATEARLIQATRRIMERDGVLAGLNLREVADEADVNRGLIYTYFGSRRDLIRAALASGLVETEQWLRETRELDFAARRRWLFESVLRSEGVAEFEALLALDGDERLQVLVDVPAALELIERDKERGLLPEDADGVALQVLTSAVYSGYALLREALARDVDVDVESLDARVLDAFERLLGSLARRDREAEGQELEGA